VDQGPCIGLEFLRKRLWIVLDTRCFAIVLFSWWWASVRRRWKMPTHPTCCLLLLMWSCSSSRIIRIVFILIFAWVGRRSFFLRSLRWCSFLCMDCSIELLINLTSREISGPVGISSLLRFWLPPGYGPLLQKCHNGTSLIVFRKHLNTHLLSGFFPQSSIYMHGDSVISDTIVDRLAFTYLPNDSLTK